MFRTSIWGLALVIACIAVTPPLSASAAPSAGQVANLKETLVAGLRVVRPQDIAWICVVVEKVDQGRLSQALVLSTFDWARKQRTSYPFAYFKRGLKVRAARAGVPL